MSGAHRQEDQVNSFAVALIGVASAILVWATIVFLQAYYDKTAGVVAAKRDEEGKNSEVRTMRAEQQAALETAVYVQGAGGERLATMPIEIAMKKVLEDAKAGKPSLVPAVGLPDQPTVPPVPGKPADGATMAAAPGAPAPAASAPGAPAPNAPAPAAPAPEAPAPNAPAPATPAPAPAPAPNPQ